MGKDPIIELAYFKLVKESEELLEKLSNMTQVTQSKLDRMNYCFQALIAEGKELSAREEFEEFGANLKGIQARLHHLHPYTQFRDKVSLQTKKHEHHTKQVKVLKEQLDSLHKTHCKHPTLLTPICKKERLDSQLETHRIEREAAKVNLIALLAHPIQTKAAELLKEDLALYLDDHGSMTAT